MNYLNLNALRKELRSRDFMINFDHRTWRGWKTGIAWKYDDKL